MGEKLSFLSYVVRYGDAVKPNVLIYGILMTMNILMIFDLSLSA